MQQQPGINSNFQRVKQPNEADMDYIEMFPQPKPPKKSDKQKLAEKLAKARKAYDKRWLKKEKESVNKFDLDGKIDLVNEKAIKMGQDLVREEWNKPMYEPQLKPKKLTDKQKLSLKLEKMKARQDKKLAEFKLKKQKQIERERSWKKNQVKKAAQPKISELKKSVQKLVNKYVRLRDCYYGEPGFKYGFCISCGKQVMLKKAEAGHYWTQGAHGNLRFNLDNLNVQCTNCNKWGHGNLLNYRIGLVNKIGEERVEWLDRHSHENCPWSREELEFIREDMNQKIAELNK